MRGQRKISSFFTTPPKKPSVDLKRQADETKITTNPAKKTRAESTSDASAKKKPEVEVNTATTVESEKPLTKSDPVKQKPFVTKPRHAESFGLYLMGDSWRKALSAELEKGYFVKLSKFISKERASQTIYPPVEDVFSWTRHCHVKDVKVAILGQDPYHGPNQAHGLCFSVKKPVRPPPSLENMFKELTSDIEGFSHPGHGDLTGWAKQGVLLLNAVLTVRAQSANSHKNKGWEEFTDAVIKHINSHNSGVVFLLWGSYAQKKGAFIDKKRHHVLRCVHPSPLSAYRGYFGCKHFSQANELLKAQGDPEIDWCAL